MQYKFLTSKKDGQITGLVPLYIGISKHQKINFEINSNLPSKLYRRPRVREKKGHPGTSYPENTNEVSKS